MIARAGWGAPGCLSHLLPGNHDSRGGTVGAIASCSVGAGAHCNGTVPVVVVVVREGGAVGGAFVVRSSRKQREQGRAAQARSGGRDGRAQGRCARRVHSGQRRRARAEVVRLRGVERVERRQARAGSVTSCLVLFGLSLF